MTRETLLNAVRIAADEPHKTDCPAFNPDGSVR